ncbi:uncharacterized protein LOC111872824 isoform X2 [Cryptotermes secundus]|uniref:uncharacterized protein LOC111872824 isoform X2 n=1 Tax=Cryptotermes secundus TaxID=105785 RepID=UPI000CD7C389|nr:uncharacterized protein LOC111872824 isoform X2 [Cryptotermes secundus]
MRSKAMVLRVFCVLVVLAVPLVVCEDDSAGAIMTNTIKNIIFCKKEHNATRDDYDAIRKSRVPQTDEGKCFMACIFEKFHVTRGGKYSADSFAKVVIELYKDELQKRERALEMVQDCGIQSDEWGGTAEKCSYPAKVMECIASYTSRIPIVKDFLKYQKSVEA